MPWTKCDSGLFWDGRLTLCVSWQQIFPFYHLSVILILTHHSHVLNLYPFIQMTILTIPPHLDLWWVAYFEVLTKDYPSFKS